MVYGSETRSMKVKDMQRLERAERMMVRWMCVVSLKDRKTNEELLGRWVLNVCFMWYGIFWAS